MEETVMKRMTQERVREAARTLERYRSGKANLEQRVRETENWWKQRHWDKYSGDAPYTSAWLFNSIINRHADAIAMYPTPNILPREPGDRETAESLSQIVPCILEQNGFEETYSNVSWQKMKQGTGIYGIFWDPDKLGGLGDISVRKIDVMSLFWEPGITDLRDSRNIFLVTGMDRDILEARYPQLKDAGAERMFSLTEYETEDRTDRERKVPVVDWYYHVEEPAGTGRDPAGVTRKLHFCRFVGDTVLYASEDDTRRPTERRVLTNADGTVEEIEVETGLSVAETGWYAHGEYPFVMDPLFPVEGSPCGFGYVDVGKSAQEQIDILNHALIRNALVGATPRYFIREDGGVNEREFADLSRPFVHVNANLGEDSIRRIGSDALHSNYIHVLNNKIRELKETSNNIDSSNGITNGVTAASGIAAQQEAAGKTSRASTMSAYRAFTRVIRQILGLIAQFYDVERMFRITGADGSSEFISFGNSGLMARDQGTEFGVAMGQRTPVFDIKISAQSKSVYTRNSRNELAVSLANLGVFDPRNTDQALLLLETMDFEGKEDVIRKVAKAGTTQQMLAKVAGIAIALAERYDPAMAEEIGMILNERADPSGPKLHPGFAPKFRGPAAAQRESNGREDRRVEAARDRAAGVDG